MYTDSDRNEDINPYNGHGDALSRAGTEETSHPVPVGICGAGTMGAGIAEAFVVAGHPVTVFDVDGAAVERALGSVAQSLAKLAARGHLEPGADEAALGRLTGTDDLAGLREALVVVEDMGVKRDLFFRLEGLVAGGAVLATNTSTLSVTEMAAGLEDPGRVVAAHFFNPAARMKLVEVTPGLATRPEVVDQVHELLVGIGKTSVRVQESPGGIVSRLQLLVRNEAVRLVAEGVATATDVDTAMKIGSGWPMGPLELIDLVGVDVHVRNSERLAREMGSNRYQPHPYLRPLVRGGRMGKKAGQGIYDYGTTLSGGSHGAPELR